jgi:hypothetical protein
MEKPNGIFDINDSDHCVGSYLKKSDIKEILEITDNDLRNVKFKYVDGYEVCHERIIRKLWKKGQIPNAIKVNRSSFDEVLLLQIIKKTYPNIVPPIRQFKVLNYFMDLKLTLDKKSVFIEYEGPDHFINPQKDLFIKKEKVEEKEGMEVINWPYWIQICSSNVKAIFEKDIKGLGALWSTVSHFGMFYYENSADIIEKLSKRFNAVDDNGYGYFYEANTRNRNKPEHPIINKIKNGEKDINLILPKGYKDANYWLPNELKKYIQT